MTFYAINQLEIYWKA